jgi:hypothetical protein
MTSRSWKLVLLVLVVLGVGAALQAADTAAINTRNKPVSTTIAPAADPNVIRQGGDTCSAATVITGLPYSDNGTTAGYTNDYDVACPYTGSTAPDIVYSYTPAAEMYVDATLCVGATGYDSKLYVYEDACPGTVADCNDDSCSSPAYASYVSSLTGVHMTVGHTYYFVVDGYGTSSGIYYLDVTEGEPPPPPPVCPTAALLYGQPAHNTTDVWSAFTSAQTTTFTYLAAEDFAGAGLSTSDFHWWGLSLLYNAGWSNCDPTGMTFDVRFYDDNAGVPGTEICAYAGVLPEMTSTGLLYSGFSGYYWQLPALTPACAPTGAAWVSVQSLNNTNDCAFLWMSGTGGNTSCQQFDGTAWTAQAYDLGMCLTNNFVFGDGFETGDVSLWDGFVP